MKVSVVYWSGTGNTQSMAEAVAQGAKDSGAEVELLSVDSATESILDSDAILFGCPAMGSEVLEESEFDPFFSSIEDRLSGKKVALFGSYDWGDGEWMRSWQERTAATGAILMADGLIANNAPDDAILAQCKELGATAAK